MRVTAHVVMQATPEAIFHALTDEREVLRHFPITGARIVGRRGGELTLTGRRDGALVTDYGRVTQWDPPHVFAYRFWSPAHGTRRAPETEVTTHYTIETVASGTRLTVTQSNLPTAELAETMEVVWPMLLGDLKTALEAG